MICLPMITVTIPAETTKNAAKPMLIGRMCEASRGKKSISVILRPLIEWKSTASTRPSSRSVDDRVPVGGHDLVVGLGSPADDRGVDDVGEQEQDDRDAGDAVEEPRPLTLVTAIDGPEVVLLLRVAGSDGHGHLRD